VPDDSDLVLCDSDFRRLDRLGDSDLHPADSDMKGITDAKQEQFLVTRFDSANFFNLDKTHKIYFKT